MTRKGFEVRSEHNLWVDLERTWREILVEEILRNGPNRHSLPTQKKVWY